MLPLVTWWLFKVYPNTGRAHQHAHLWSPRVKTLPHPRFKSDGTRNISAICHGIKLLHHAIVAEMWEASSDYHTVLFRDNTRNKIHSSLAWFLGAKSSPIYSLMWQDELLVLFSKRPTLHMFLVNWLLTQFKSQNYVTVPRKPFFFKKRALTLKWQDICTS